MNSTKSAIVRVEGLVKDRGKRRALDGVSLTIPRGSAFGLIGPNGAGKTTAIKILLGMLRPDAGTVEVLGAAPMQLPALLRQRIGYLSEQSGGRELPNLPIAELLEYQSHFFTTWDWPWCQRLLDRMGVVAGRPLFAMSEGERRKAQLLVAMAHRPELLILDDPMLGLDPRARREMLGATLAMVHDEGTTILFTSHVLQDVERMVDHVLLLDRGRVRLAGPLDEVLAGTKRLVFPEAGAGLEALAGEVRRQVHGRDVTVVVRDLTTDAVAALQRRHANMQIENLNLEEIFCAVIDDVKPEPTAEPASKVQP